MGLTAALRIAAGGALFAACGIADLDVTGKRCPCPGGYTCDPLSNSCQRQAADAGIDASSDAAADTLTSDAPADGASCPPVPDAERVTIASGRRHVCAIKPDKTLWCWGNNDQDQLGTGGPNASTPTEVMPSGNWDHVSALGDHTCAIRDGTRLYCWGSNAVGQVGSGNTDPQPVPVNIDVNRNWRYSASGEGISCAIMETPTPGKLYCWGTDAGGAAGTGQAIGIQSSPYPAEVSEPTVTFAQVGTGSYNGCAIAHDGRLFCWGQNDCFKTGVAEQTLRPEPVGSGCHKSFAGGHHHGCTIDADGRLFCFGSNEQGALGIGVIGQGTSDGMGCTDAYLEPQPVLPELRWRSVAAGYLSTCAISEQRELWCWGFNQERGVASADGDQTSPVKVNDDTDWAFVAPGMFHTCAQKLDGSVYCMGGAGDVGPVKGPLAEIVF